MTQTHCGFYKHSFIRPYAGRLVPTVPELWLTAVKEQYIHPTPGYCDLNVPSKYTCVISI